MESVSLYSEARNEYIKQMATWVVPQLVEFFRREYDRLAATEGKRVMSAFQNWCSEVPRWNQDVIDAHVNELLDNCKCDYIEDLMTAVFIAHTKMLTAIRVNNRQKKLQITLPKLDHFLHRVFVECARAFWKAPFLFTEEGSPIERQKNVLQAEAMCVEALSGAVRSLLPVKNILRDNLLEEEEEVVAPSHNRKDKDKHKKHRKYDSSSSDSESSSSDEEDAKRKKGGAKTHIVPTVVVPEAPVIAESHPEPELDISELVEEVVDPTPVFTLAAPVPVETVAAVPAPVAAAPAPVAAAPAPVAAAPAPVAAAPAPVAAPVAAPAAKPLTVTKEPAAVQLIKDETVAAGEHVVIDTEPTVKFSPYEMVYDENTLAISEMRYAPKMSIEEMPDKPPYEPVYASDDDEDAPPPRINIGSDYTSLSGSDIDIVDVGSEDSPMELSDADFETL